MKVSIRNRKYIIPNVNNLLTETGMLHLLHNKDYHRYIIDTLTVDILLSKIKSNEGLFNTKLFSNKFNSILIDSYERALAHFNLYCFQNNIDCEVGYFYIIGNNSFPNYYKLGCSKDAEARLNSYQTASPHRDYYLRKYIINSDYRKTETHVLKRIKDKMFNGEWIRSNEPDDLFKQCCKLISNELNMYNRFSTNSNLSLESRFSCLRQIDFNNITLNAKDLTFMIKIAS